MIQGIATRMTGGDATLTEIIRGRTFNVPMYIYAAIGRKMRGIPDTSKPEIAPMSGIIPASLAGIRHDDINTGGV